MKIHEQSVQWFRSLRRVLVPPTRRKACSGLSACALQEQQLKKITDGLSPEVLIGIVSAHAVLTQVNRSSREALGYTDTEVVGLPVEEVPWWSRLATTRERVAKACRRGLQGEASRFDIEVQTRCGNTRVLDLMCMPLFSDAGPVKALILSGRDITERVQAQARSAYLASHDTLTGLPNRQQLLACVEQRLQRNTSAPTSLSILALGLDRLNWVNEALGPVAGDTVLTTFARRLVEHPCDDVVAARLGGDVFALLVPEPLGEAQRRAHALQRRLQTAMIVKGRTLHVGFCVGVAEIDTTTAQAQDAQALLQRAETALCEAKTLGSGSVSAFVAPPPSSDLPRLFLLSDLHSALDRRELVVHYQPQWDARTRRVIGAEALLRWHHPKHGRIAPDRFIPIAEDSGLILSIGAWVLHQACASARRWQRMGLGDLHVSVNVSPRQLRGEGFAATVASALEQTGLRPGCLVLEVTESALMEDVEHAGALLATLRRTGVTIALDDFGTGYSSLGQLRQLPIDLLKIDRSLVPDVAAGAEAVSITRAIITMAASLKLQVLAEGVESASQLDLLAASGCHLTQGYHIGMPMAEADFVAWLRPFLAADAAPGDEAQRVTPVTVSQRLVPCF